MENQANNVRTEVQKTGVVLDKIYAAQYQKDGTLTAQIRQDITTDKFYPGKQTATEMQGNIFNTAEFGFAEQKFSNTEHRVAWIPVPVAATEEQVKAKLEEATKNGACLYKVLHNHPIIDRSQEYAIGQGLTTKDILANSQVVRYPEGHPEAGKLTLDSNGKVQYRRVFFWNTPMDDQDARTAEPSDVYQSPEIAAELAGASVMNGQTI